MAALFVSIVDQGMTMKSIVKFMEEKGDKMIDWFRDEIVKAQSIDETKGFNAADTINMEDIQTSLKKVHNKMVEMKQTLSEIGVQINWEHLNTRIFSAEMDICHKFELLQSILSIKGKVEREAELERLRLGILDANSGVLQSLSVIHQVLVGHALVNHPEKGLLEMWSNAIYEKMIAELWPAKKYNDLIMNHLQTVAILQFKGFLLFAGANEDHTEFCKKQISLLIKRLEHQKETLEGTIPKSTQYLVNPTKESECILNFYSAAAAGFEIDLHKAKWKFEMSRYSAGYNQLCITTKTLNGTLCLGYSNESSLKLAVVSYDKKSSEGFNVTPIRSTCGERQIIISLEKECVLNRNSKFESDNKDAVFTLT